MDNVLHQYNTTLPLIDNFRGEYYFLSNYFPCHIEIDGKKFLNAEAAFQAHKCPARVDEFTSLSPNDAKKLGRSVELRSDWDQVRVGVMYKVLNAKFRQNGLLGFWLHQTGTAILIEGNTWHDTFWGVCNGKGKNTLGSLLMQIRKELNEEKYNANI